MEKVANSHSGAARTLEVLGRVAQNTPVSSSVTALARDLDLSKAVVHRILQQLTASDFVAYDVDSRQYSLGSNSLLIGMAALRSLDVPKVARPYLEELAHKTGTTATLSVRHGWTRVYIDQVVSAQEIRMTVSIGTAHPLHAGSSSKSILAALEDDEIEQYLEFANLAAVTDATITDRDQLRLELKKIREQGYSGSTSERQPGAASVAAAVSTAGVAPWGSISVCGPRDLFTPDIHRQYGLLVKDTARAISVACGHVNLERQGR